MAIDKINRVVLHSTILSELDSKVTKTELSSTITDLQNSINSVVTINCFSIFSKKYSNKMVQP